MGTGPLPELLELPLDLQLQVGDRELLPRNPGEHEPVTLLRIALGRSAGTLQETDDGTCPDRETQ